MKNNTADKPLCNCELRNRQWDGYGRCLTCGRKYEQKQLDDLRRAIRKWPFNMSIADKDINTMDNMQLLESELSRVEAENEQLREDLEFIGVTYEGDKLVIQPSRQSKWVRSQLALDDGEIARLTSRVEELEAMVNEADTINFDTLYIDRPFWDNDTSGWYIFNFQTDQTVLPKTRYGSALEAYAALKKEAGKENE